LRQLPGGQGDDDADNADQLGDLRDLPAVFATEYLNWRPGWLQAESHKTAGESTSEATTLNNEEMRFLKTVKDYPGRPSGTYAGLARISKRKAIAIRKRLVEMRFLRETRVNASSRGGTSIVIELTRRAFELLEEEDR
jgi:hypothetical protein